MRLGEFFKEFDADLRNKLNYPRVLLNELLRSDSRAGKKQIRQAVKDLDRAVTLTKKWSVLFSKKSRGKGREL